MRKVLTLSVATCLLAGVAVAQTPNRSNPPNATVAPPNTPPARVTILAWRQPRMPTILPPRERPNSFTEGEAKVESRNAAT